MTPAQRSEFEHQSRLRSLLGRWSRTREKIDQTYGKAGALGDGASLKPSLFRKLTSWMEQITGLKLKEQDLLSEITDIEKRHAQLRKERKLRRAKPADALQTAPVSEPVRRKKTNPWLWAFFLLVLTQRNKKT